MSRVSHRGVRFVARWEGFCRFPYRDAVGVWTIGYGETQGVGPHSGPITQEQAQYDLGKRLTRDYLPAVPRRRLMKQQEKDALASFAYNLGPGAVGNPSMSTLAHRLMSFEGLTFRKRKRIYREELPKWDKAGGRPLAGLTKRRAAEVKLACYGDYSGHP
jgi:lysozyme